MLDVQLLRNDLADVASKLAARGYTLDAAKFEQLEGERKAIQVRTQSFKRSATRLLRRLDKLRLRARMSRRLWLRWHR